MVAWGRRKLRTLGRSCAHSTCFPCGSAGKESACSTGDLGSIPGLERSGEGKGLENSMDYIVHGVTKSQTQLSNFHFHCTHFSSVQSLSRVRGFVTPGTAARQASLSITSSRSLPKLMPIESVMPSNHLILCCSLLLPPSILPSIRVFSNESALFASGGQSIEVSASTSVLKRTSTDLL